MDFPPRRPFITALLMVSLIAIPLTNAEADPSDAPDSMEWNGSDAQKIWGLMTVWAEVNYTFPHFGRMPELDWDAEVRACIPKVVETQDLDSYYAVLMELVANLKDSHTVVLPPWGHLRPGYDLAPVEIRIARGRFYVDRVGERPELVEDAIQPGAELLAIDGIPARPYFSDKVLRYHSQGTPQADEAILAVYLLYGPGGEKTVLQIRNPDGATADITVTRDAMSAEPPFFPRLLINAFASPTIRSRVLPGKIQYVEIPNFEHDQAQTDFEILIDTQDASSIQGMIIDLRNNMGGASAISEPMLACLIDQTVPSPTMKFRHFVGAHEAWGNDTIWDTTYKEIHPRSGTRYLGPLVVLTNGATNSSAEDFAIELRTAGRAQLVGQRTAGGAGNALTSKLPGGGTLRVATFTALTPEGEEYVGVGIAPDMEVEVTPEDLAAERDPVLDRAVELIRGR